MDERISRRGLLGAAGVAVAAQGKALGANDKIVGALIGCGGMGRGNMNNFMGHGGVIAAVCDVDESHVRAAAADVEKRQGKAPEQIKDFRKLLERKDIDAVIIGTPDHWHALPFITACEAEKDIYCEKPISHNITEGRSMVGAAKRFNRVVQVGTWQRSTKDFVDAIDYIRSGKLGKVATVVAWKTDQFTLGKNSPQPVPAGFDWDFWLGPAKKVEYTGKNGHFNWRWFFNTAAGNTGDWGVHMMDIGLLAMSKDTDLVMPTKVASVGGKISSGEGDDRTTPDTQIAIYQFPDFVMKWQTGRRGLEYGYKRTQPAGDGGPPMTPQDMLSHGTAFYNTDGASLVVWRGGWMVRDREGNELPKTSAPPVNDHMQNWIDCIKSRELPRSNIRSMYQTTATCHLANIAFLTGETIHWDKSKDDIVGHAGKDTLPYAREYRKPWKLPIYKG